MICPLCKEEFPDDCLMLLEYKGGEYKIGDVKQLKRDKKHIISYTVSCKHKINLENKNEI